MNTNTLTDHERALAEKVAVRSILPVEGVELMTQIAKIFDVTCGELVGERRTARLTDARSVIAFVLYGRGWTKSQVGELLNRNPSTAHHLSQRIAKDRELSLLARQVA